MLAEELAIWAIVGVALLLVAAIIWRGEAMPKIETSAHENRPDYRHIQAGDANFEERAWLAINRYGHDGGGQPTGPLSQASVEVGVATERALPLQKVEAPAEGSLEGAAEALPELEDRIAILRDNIRHLVEQATGAAGGQNEERTADRDFSSRPKNLKS